MCSYPDCLQFTHPTAPLSSAESPAAVTPAARNARPPFGSPVDTHAAARPSSPTRRPPTGTSSNEPPVRPPVGIYAPSTTTTTTRGAADRESVGSHFSDTNSPQQPLAPSAAAPQGGIALKTAPQLRKISPAIRLPAFGGDAPMGADDELVAKPDDEEDEQLGTVQRTFVSFLLVRALGC